MSTVCSLNALGGKPLVSGSASTYSVLISSNAFKMILDFLLYNIKLNVNVFGSTLELLS